LPYPTNLTPHQTEEPPRPAKRPPWGVVTRSTWERADLAPALRVLLAYLCTCPVASDALANAGLFRLYADAVSEHLGWSREEVERGLADLAGRGAIAREGAWVWVSEAANPTVSVNGRNIGPAIERQLLAAPSKLVELFRAHHNPSQKQKHPAEQGGGPAEAAPAPTPRTPEPADLVVRAPFPDAGSTPAAGPGLASVADPAVMRAWEVWRPMFGPAGALTARRRREIEAAIRDHGEPDVLRALRGAATDPRMKNRAAYALTFAPGDERDLQRFQNHKEAGARMEQEQRERAANDPRRPTLFKDPHLQRIAERQRAQIVARREQEHPPEPVDTPLTVEAMADALSGKEVV
jgi:hypothetical protein